MPAIQPSVAPTDLVSLASTTAQQYGLNEARFIAVVRCESGFDPNAVGDHGTSFGLAQLHNPSSDWGISTSTAFDPTSALTIMAKAWVAGQQTRWSCWRNLYGVDNYPLALPA